MLRESHLDGLSVTDAAREAQVSLYHFIRTFNSAFGQTPHEFRTQIRIEKAKELLIIGNHSITDICMELGYSSVGSFSSLFMKHSGVPPSTFRRNLRSMVQVPGMFPRELVPYCFAAMYAKG
jgi:AraC-like DNA-binding protein